MAMNDEICRHRWMSLCVGRNGEPYIRAGRGVFIVPVNEADEVLFIVEPAVTDGKPVLWLPSGTVENGESPRDAANRELQEEIGYKAERLDQLAELHPMARHADCQVFAFLARNLIGHSLRGDEPHKIDIEPRPFAEFERQIASGRLRDSSCIAALYLARAFVAAESSGHR